MQSTRRVTLVDAADLAGGGATSRTRMDSRIQQVDQLLDEGAHFDARNFSSPDDDGGLTYGGQDSPEWLTWKTRVLNLVQAAAAEGSPALALAKTGFGIRTKGNYRNEVERAKSNLLEALALLKVALTDDSFGELRESHAESKSPLLSTRVFVVHGHDEALTNEVERFLYDVGLQPVVLHRQPDQGQTVIEKFEQHGDVGYAIVLLTPDDCAYSAAEGSLPDAQRQTELRARPNVLFEFGYFVGRLGRARVCCLHKGAVAVPSDLNGLVYKSVADSFESQAFALVRELKAAGYSLKL